MAAEKNQKDTHLLISPDIHRRIKVRAAENGLTMRSFAEACLARCLEEPPPQKQRPSPAPPAPGSGVQREE